jgi:L-lactate utilization protein LutB
MEDREVMKQYYRKRAARLIEKMEKKGFKAFFAATGEEAKEKVLSLIPEGGSVILTGSQTLEQLGVKSYIRESGKFEVIDPYEPGISPAESLGRRRAGLTADVMVSSSNAVTEDGALVNIDGMGNRVAGMIFGPTKVVLAVSMNKVQPDVDTAFKRVRDVAAPMNNMRLELANPCTETGFCADCKNKSRICNYFSVIERSFIPERIQVVLIGRELGY